MSGLRGSIVSLSGEVANLILDSYGVDYIDSDKETIMLLLRQPFGNSFSRKSVTEKFQNPVLPAGKFIFLSAELNHVGRGSN